MSSVQEKPSSKKEEKALRGLEAARRRIHALETELKSLKEELTQERGKREEAEEILRKREPVLTERVKEISCLYSVVSLLTNPDYPSEEDRIRDIVKIVPTGWGYPEDAWAHVTFRGKEFHTPNFVDTPWKQTAEFSMGANPGGTLTVGYLQEKPKREEGPFWLEERTLLDILAKLIGEIAGPKLLKEYAGHGKERG